MLLNKSRFKQMVAITLSIMWVACLLSRPVFGQQSMLVHSDSPTNGGPEFVDAGIGTPLSFHEIGNILLIGTDKGLYRWNNKLDGAPQVIDPGKIFPDRFHQVSSIYQWASTLLLATEKGLYRWNERLEGTPELMYPEIVAAQFHPIDKALLIGANKGLYRWNTTLDGTPEPVAGVDGTFRFLYSVGSTLLIGAERGLYRWNDKLEGTPQLLDSPVMGMYSFHRVDSELFIGASSGLYRWNDKLIGTPQLIDGEMGAVYRIHQVGNSLLVAAESGLYRWDLKLNKRSQLVDAGINLTSFYQIGATILIGASSALYRWNDTLTGPPRLVDSGIGAVAQLYQMGSNLLIGGQGVFRWNDRLEDTPKFADPEIRTIWSFHPMGSALLVGAQDGLYLWNENLEGTPRLVDAGMGAVYRFHQAGGTLLIATEKGLYQWNDKFKGTPEILSARIRAIFSFHQVDRTILIGVPGGVFRWNSSLSGAPEFMSLGIGTPHGFYEVGDTLLVATERGLYRWNYNSNGVPELVSEIIAHDFQLVDHTLLIGAETGPGGRPAGGLYRWNDKLEGSPQGVFPGTVYRFLRVGSSLLIGTSDGLFKVGGVGIKWDAGIEIAQLPKEILSSLNLIVKWKVRNYELRANPQNVTIRVILTDETGAIVSKDAGGNKTTPDQWWLQGQSQMTMPNLSPGKYRLTIQATDLTGNTSESEPLAFNVYSSLFESLLDWGKFLSFLYIVITAILFLVLLVGARKSKRCFDILTDPLMRKIGIYFGFALRYVRPIRIWVLERYFDELKKDWSNTHLYVPYHLIPPGKEFDGTPVDPIESTEIIKRLSNELRILILGGPGTGKSALARNLMQTYCNETSLRAAWKKYGFIPIWIRLRELVGSQSITVSELARSALDGKEMTFDREGSFFESLLRNSDFVIVLDGLNEVNIDGALSEFAVTHSSVRLIATSQTDSISDSFTRYRLPFFDPAFAKTLLRKLVGDAPADAAIKGAPGLWKEVKCGYDVRLVEQLIRQQSKAEGQETSDSGKDSPSLPQNRVELYTAMVESSKREYERVAIQIKPFPSARICEHAWNMWKNGQFSFQPDEGLTQIEVEHLVKTNLALKRPQSYEFVHSLMRDFLSAEFCAHHSGPTTLMVKTRMKGEDGQKIWRLPPDDQAPVFSFLTESIETREDLQEIFQFASEKIKERYQLMIAAQETAKKKGWQTQVSIDIDL